MERPENKINRRGRSSTQSAAAFLLVAGTVALGAVTATPAANAQTAHKSHKKSSGGTIVIKEVNYTATHPYSEHAEAIHGDSSYVLTAYSGPPASADAVRGVFQRAAAMLQVARVRSGSGPMGSRQSYRAAASALSQALQAGGYSANSGVSMNAANIPVSSADITMDIQTLRSAGNPSRMNRVATFYANGAKEFFTGQLRDALLGNGSASANIVIRGRGGYGNSSSAVMPAGQGGYVAGTPRGAQQGGVIQPDGSTVNTVSSPQNPPPPQPDAPSPGGTGTVNVTQPPPVAPTVAPAPPIIVPVGTPTVPVVPATPVVPAVPTSPTVPTGS